MPIVKPTRTLALAALLAMAGGTTAAAEVPAIEAARQLLDFAEASFKVYLPEHQVTRPFGAFRYRAYSSGVVLGVVVAPDPNYLLNGVYVMGGPFGPTPRAVGQVSDFITPVEPGTGPSGPNNGCYDLGLWSASGVEINATYELEGPRTGNQTITRATNANALFEGQLVVETIVKTSGTVFDNGLPVDTADEIRTYHRRTGEAELTQLGTYAATTATTNDYIRTTTLKTLYTPAWVDRIYALGVGQALSSSWTSTTTATTSYLNNVLPTTTSTYGGSNSETVRYIGRETITVPAGTYATCRFERTSASATGGVTVDWVLAGHGALVKRQVFKENSTQTMSARSLMSGGNPL
ncbi:MAG: hypothetical protein HY855_09555 [Burkholderiales bacterium]|nr:hypothetical protein [Burkholderiales bacterium]